MIGKLPGLVFLLVTPCVVAQGPVNALKETLARVNAEGKSYVSGHRLSSPSELSDFYRSRDYKLLWTSASARSAVDVVNGADTHGLLAADYQAKYLSESLLRLASATALERAEFELLLTDSLIRYARHLRYGKVDPVKSSSPLRGRDTGDIDDMLQQMAVSVASGQIDAWMRSLVPSHSVYSQMKAALVRYRALAEQGGWQRLPAGPWLQLGVKHHQIPVLRKRLRITGDLAGERSVVPQEFDLALDRAVRHFQRRNGLAVDGIVGPETRADLNVPVSARVDQLRTNLERARWVLHNIKGRTVVINLAGFSIYLAEDERIQWSSRVVIGRTYRKTPVFRSQIRYLVLNPSWVVPPTIFKKDILPLAIQDPGVLRSKGLKVLSKSGAEIAPESIEWQRYQSQAFPYVLRQDPGPDNALGKIKFVFPNPYTVFMHDTPQRELFDHHERAFSSGCIRLKAPMELAALLLSASPQWNEEKLLTAVETGRTQTIALPEPVDIVIIYWTAGADPRGVVHFRRDIYKRDAAVLAALDRPLGR